MKQILASVAAELLGRLILAVESRFNRPAPPNEHPELTEEDLDRLLTRASKLKDVH